jgi:hypothetical protein
MGFEQWSGRGERMAAAAFWGCGTRKRLRASIAWARRSLQGRDLSLQGDYKISDTGGRELTRMVRCQTKVDRYRNGIIQGR